MELVQWLTNICKSETPDKTIVAFYFGIYQTVEGYEMYLSGSKEYSDCDNDWASGSDFVPREKYLALDITQYKNLEWQDLLEKVKKELMDFKKTEMFESSFFNVAKAIAVGFDDGDLHFIDTKV